MNESCEGINFHDVLDLIPREMAVLVRRDGPPWCEKILLDQRAFGRFRFEAVKWIRQRPKPEDRCWTFETIGPHGCWSLDKEEHLIESRKTRAEKEQERQEEHELRELMRKHGIR